MRSTVFLSGTQFKLRVYDDNIIFFMRQHFVTLRSKYKNLILSLERKINLTVFFQEWKQ